MLPLACPAVDGDGKKANGEMFYYHLFLELCV